MLSSFSTTLVLLPTLVSVALPDSPEPFCSVSGTVMVLLSLLPDFDVLPQPAASKATIAAITQVPFFTIT